MTTFSFGCYCILHIHFKPTMIACHLLQFKSAQCYTGDTQSHNGVSMVCCYKDWTYMLQR